MEIGKGYENMTIEEINALIEENNKKISKLKEKVEQTKKEKERNLKEVIDLISEISNTEKLYYDYRTILGSPFFELTDSERSSIESMMPIYEQKIKILKKKFQNTDFTKIFWYYNV